MNKISFSVIKIIQKHTDRLDWREGEQYSILNQIGFDLSKAVAYCEDCESFIFRKYLAGIVKQYHCIHKSYFNL